MARQPGEVRIGLIEIGTNSTKMLIAGVRGSGQFNLLFSSRKTTRIGGGLRTTGRLAKRGVRDTTAAIRDFGTIARRMECRSVLVFSTFAMRKAGDGAEAARRIAKSTGYEIKILTGLEEAHFAFLSARERLKLKKRFALLFDVGGGSTECVFAAGGRVRSARSLPLGALHLTERFVRNDPMKENEYLRLKAHVGRTVRGALEAMASPPLRAAATDLAASGGSISALARMSVGRGGAAAASPEGLRGPVRVRSRDVAWWLERCRSLPLEERRRIPGLDPDRADIITAGLVVVDAFMRATGKRILHASDGGVRHGVLLHLIGNGFRW